MFDIELVLPFSLGIVTAINPVVSGKCFLLLAWIFHCKDTADSQARPEQVSQEV